MKRVLVALTLVVGILGPMAPAGAVRPPLTVTVKPSTELVDLQVVTVKWKGFTARGRPVPSHVWECRDGWQRVDLRYAHDYCGQSHPAPVSIFPMTKHGTTSFPVRTSVDDNVKPYGACSDWPGGCWLVVAQPGRQGTGGAWSMAAGAPITFAAPAGRASATSIPHARYHCSPEGLVNVNFTYRVPRADHAEHVTIVVNDGQRHLVVRHVRIPSGAIYFDIFPLGVSSARDVRVKFVGRKVTQVRKLDAIVC